MGVGGCFGEPPLGGSLIFDLDSSKGGTQKILAICHFFLLGPREPSINLLIYPEGGEAVFGEPKNSPIYLEGKSAKARRVDVVHASIFLCQPPVFSMGGLILHLLPFPSLPLSFRKSPFSSKYNKKYIYVDMWDKPPTST